MIKTTSHWSEKNLTKMYFRFEKTKDHNQWAQIMLINAIGEVIEVNLEANSSIYG